MGTYGATGGEIWTLVLYHVKPKHDYLSLHYADGGTLASQYQGIPDMVDGVVMPEASTSWVLGNFTPASDDDPGGSVSCLLCNQVVKLKNSSICSVEPLRQHGQSVTHMNNLLVGGSSAELVGSLDIKYCHVFTDVLTLYVQSYRLGEKEGIARTSAALAKELESRGIQLPHGSNIDRTLREGSLLSSMQQRLVRLISQSSEKIKLPKGVEGPAGGPEAAEPMTANKQAAVLQVIFSICINN